MMRVLPETWNTFGTTTLGQQQQYLFSAGSNYLGQQQDLGNKLLNSQAPKNPNTPSPARTSKVLGVLRVCSHL